MYRIAIIFILGMSYFAAAALGAAEALYEEALYEEALYKWNQISSRVERDNNAEPKEFDLFVDDL